MAGILPNAVGDKPVLVHALHLDSALGRSNYGPTRMISSSGIICVRGRRSDSDYQGAAANSDSAGKADARPPMYGGQRHYLPLAGQSWRRYADHFRVELDDVSVVILAVSLLKGSRIHANVIGADVSLYEAFSGTCVHVQLHMWMLSIFVLRILVRRCSSSRRIWPSSCVTAAVLFLGFVRDTEPRNIWKP